MPSKTNTNFVSSYETFFHFMFFALLLTYGPAVEYLFTNKNSTTFRRIITSMINSSVVVVVCSHFSLDIVCYIVFITSLQFAFCTYFHLFLLEDDIPK